MIRTQFIVGFPGETDEQFEELLEFVKDFLSPRTASVITHGVMSKSNPLVNMVFQDTVLGPPLWNVFFKDVCNPIRELDYRKAK